MDGIDVKSLSTEQLDALIGQLGGQLQAGSMAPAAQAGAGGAAGPSRAAEGEPLDPTRSAGFLERAAASFKRDPLAYYASKYGAENVTRGVGNEIVIRDPATGKRFRADPAGFDLGDIADFAGDVPEVAGATLGAIAGGAGGGVAGPAGMAGGAMMGGARGAAIGNMLKQAIGGALPGEEKLDLGGRAVDVGAAALGGAVGEGAGQLVGRMLPKGFLAGQVQKGLGAGPGGAAIPRTPQAAEGLALQREMGDMPMSPGQITQDQGLLAIEDYLRNNVFVRQKWMDFAKNQISFVDARINRLLNQMGPGIDDTAIGNGLKNTLNEGFERLGDLRRRQAQADFGMLSTVVGDTPLVAPNNLRNLLQSIVDASTYRGEVGAAGKPAEEMLRRLNLSRTWNGRMSAGLPLSAKETQQMLQEIGDMAYGGGAKLFDQLTISGEKKFGRRMYAALQQDLEATLQQGGMPGQVAAVFKAARDNYAQNTSAMKELASSSLRRIVGKADGDSVPVIANRLLNLHPDQVASTLNILQAVDPVRVQEVQRFFLQNAYDKAMAANVRRAGPSALPFDPNTFIKSLPDDRTLNAVYGPQLAREIRAAGETLQRINSRAFAGESPTAPRQMVADTIRMMLSPSKWIDIPKFLFAPQAMTAYLTDPAGIKALRELSMAQAPTVRTASAISQLVTMAAMDAFDTPEDQE